MISGTWAISIFLSLAGLLCQEENVCDFNKTYSTIALTVVIPSVFLAIIVLSVRICLALKNREFKRKLELNATTLLLITTGIACILWIPGIITYAFYQYDQQNDGKLFGYLFLYYTHPIINACLYGYAIKKGTH